MIIDKLNEFADATSVAASASTFIVGNVIDTAALSRDLGDGEPVYCVMTVDTEVITGGTAGTIQFYLCSDANASLNDAGTGAAVVAETTTHWTSGSLVTDDAAANAAILSAGQLLACFALPKGTYERYLGVVATVGTTTTTAGKINAFLTMDPVYTGKQYADALTVATGQ